MSGGAGIGGTRSRGRASGDATVESIVGASQPIPARHRGSDPQRGPSSAPRRAPVSGDAVYYFPRTGKVRVKKLRDMHNDTIFEREQDYGSRLRRSEIRGEVELFS